MIVDSVPKVETLNGSNYICCSAECRLYPHLHPLRRARGVEHLALGGGGSKKHGSLANFQCYPSGFLIRCVYICGKDQSVVCVETVPFCLSIRNSIAAPIETTDGLHA